MNEYVNTLELIFGDSFKDYLKNNKQKWIDANNKQFSNLFNPRFKGRNLNLFVNYTLNKLNSMFNYTGDFDKIHYDKAKLNRHRFTKGFFTIVEHNGEWWVLDSNLGGELDEFYNPTKIIVNNPHLRLEREYTNGEDGFIIWNDASHLGLLPQIFKYGGFITETELTIFTNLIISRLPVLHISENDETKEQIDDFYKNLENGSLGSIVDEQLFENMTKARSVPNVSNNQDFMYLTELHTFFYSLLFNEIGIDANKTLKREALASDEVGVNSQAIFPQADDMLNTSREGLEKFNEKTGMKCGIEFGSSWLVNHDENKNLVNDLDEGGDEKDGQDTSDSVSGENLSEHESGDLESKPESES